MFSLFTIILIIVFIVPVKTKREIFFAGGLFRVFDRGQNNCYFDSTVKNTNVPQTFLCGTFYFDRHNISIFIDMHLQQQQRKHHLYQFFFIFLQCTAINLHNRVVL